MAANKLRNSLCCLLVAIAMPVSSLAAPRSAMHTVVIEGMQFAPAELSVHVGDTVVWKNKDAFPHTATSIKGRFDSRAVATGHSWKYVAKRRGEFPYLCTLHTTMRGKLTVK